MIEKIKPVCLSFLWQGLLRHLYSEARVIFKMAFYKRDLDKNIPYDALQKGLEMSWHWH